MQANEIYFRLYDHRSWTSIRWAGWADDLTSDELQGIIFLLSAELSSRTEAPQDLAVPEVGGSPALLPPARSGSDIWAEGVAAGLGERRRPTHTVEREIISELQETIRVQEARIAVLGVSAATS